jgi:hypothetical protein
VDHGNGASTNACAYASTDASAYTSTDACAYAGSVRLQ